MLIQLWKYIFVLSTTDAFIDCHELPTYFEKFVMTSEQLPETFQNCDDIAIHN